MPAFRFRVDEEHFENGAFRKRSPNRRNLKNTGFFRFRVDGKHILKTKLFENDGVRIIM